MKIINYYDEDYHEENHIITNTHIYSYQIFFNKTKRKRFSDPVRTNENIQNTLMARIALLKKDMGSSLYDN